jgi:hypothetical protein
VIIVDENKPRGHWEMARIEELYPGDDGVIRTVKVKTLRNAYIRPISKVCVLEESVCSN